MITRNYNPDARTTIGSGSVLSTSGPYDSSSLNFSYADNPALQGGINSTFQDLLGRDATAEELAKYGVSNPDNTQFNSVIQKIVTDNFDQIGDDKLAQYLGDPVGDPYRKATRDDYAQKYTSQDNPYGGGVASAFSDAYVKNKYSTADNGDANMAYADQGEFRTQDVAQFLTKMDAKQTAALFKDTGLDDQQAANLSGWIASQDWSGVKEGDIAGKLGLNDDQLNTLGRAMFADRDVSAGNNTLGQRYEDVAKENSDHRFAVAGDSDNNNADYKQFTVYDPKKGLHFTGGYIPEKPQADWMGNLVLGALLAGGGFIAGAGIANAATSLFPSLGTVGYAGGIVPGMAANVAGGVTAGALTGGLNADAHGGNFARGARTGGIMGGIGAIGTPSITGNRMIDSGISGAVRGGVGAAVGGGDVSTGVISGGLSGAVSPVIRNVVPGVAGSMVNGYVNSAIRSALTDDPAPRIAPNAPTGTSTPVATGPVDLNTIRRTVRR